MKIKEYIIWSVIGLNLSIFTSVETMAAGEATVVQMQGKVSVFSNPAAKPLGPGPHVLYEGFYYRNQRARVGTKLTSGSVVQTAPGARAKIIFANGDHMSVGQGTSFKVEWEEDAEAKTSRTASVLKLYHGKMRTMISPTSPRSGMRIKTQAAVAGVRGTDFYVSFFADEGTELKVLRGEVVIKADESSTEESKISAGYSAKIDPPQVLRPLEEPAVVLPKVQLEVRAPTEVAKKTSQEIGSTEAIPQKDMVSRKISVVEVTKEELLDVQRISAEIVSSESKGNILSKEQVKEQKELMSLATKAVLEDIQKDNPEQYEQFKNRKLASLSDISAGVVSNLYRAAPRAEVKSKPSESDLEDLGKGVYQKYFKEFDK